MPQILGVKIDSVSKTEARQQAEIFLLGDTQKKIFTPNPEMLVLAQKDLEFKNILNSGDLNLCDGFGIRLVSGFKIQRLTGVDFVLELCALAEVLGKGVFLLGTGDDGVLNQAVEKLRTQFPLLKIAGVDKGPQICLSFPRKRESSGQTQMLDPRLHGDDSTAIDGGDSSRSLRSVRNDILAVDEMANQTIINKINQAQPDILFVAFGQVKQEKWINEFLPKLPSVKIAMGVGGSFDYVSGQISRAPLFFRQIGLEWVYRLFRQPARFGRIFNATVKFIYYILRQRFLAVLGMTK